MSSLPSYLRHLITGTTKQNKTEVKQGNLRNMECRNAGMPEFPESWNPRNNYKNYKLKNKLIKLN